MFYRQLDLGYNKREHTMTIGEVAKLSEVNIQTIRFYERKGIVLPDARSDSGYRQYTDDAVRRVRFIKHAQEIGFSLREISDLLALRVDDDTACAEVRSRAEEKLSDVEQKIRKLKQVKQALKGLVAQCDIGKTVSDCPILEALDEVEFTF